MPLHEYECEQCGHRFEVIQKFSDPPIETCPKCGGKVRKLFASPAIQFKGSGWYVTDYAKKKESAGAASEKSSTEQSKSAETSSAGEAKSDKSASPSEAKSSSDSKPSGGS